MEEGRLYKFRMHVTMAYHVPNAELVAAYMRGDDPMRHRILNYGSYNQFERSVNELLLDGPISFDRADYQPCAGHRCLVVFRRGRRVHPFVECMHDLRGWIENATDLRWNEFKMPAKKFSDVHIGVDLTHVWF